ncbi:MAG TPA: hypothetical protein VJL28_13990 [Gemmatimonadaceae bacterium]|nr:hypothetical protein [Gemmatimonadaceae bacterium]
MHGVGSPAPLSTAQATAELLVRHQPNGARFSAFEERRLTIPTDKLNITPSRWDTVAPRSARPAAAPPPPPPPPAVKQSRLAARLEEDRSALGRNRDRPSGPDIAFMREQLDGYESDHAPYETAELVGERTDATGARTAVHVFEMYWADLSRVGSGLLRVLGTIYQLILHISHLGRKTLDVAWQYAPDPEDLALNEAWRRFSACHAWAVRLFTIGVPLATVLMLCWSVLFVPAAIPANARPVAGIAASAIIAIAAAGLLCFTRLKTASAATAFVLLSLAILGAGGWLYWTLPARAGLLGTGILSVTLGLVTLVAYEATLRFYERSRPGALVLGRVGALLLLALTAVSWPLVDRALEPAEIIRQLAFFAFQWGYILNMLLWLTLWGVAFAAFLLGVRVWQRTTAPVERRRMRRAGWTARVTLCFSLFAFIVTVLIGYQAMLALASQYTSWVDLLPKAQLRTVATWFLPAARGAVPDFLQALIAAGGTSALPWIIAGLGFALLLVLWFLLLVGFTSARRLSEDWKFSRQLGEWFTAGFVWLRASGNLATSVIYGGFIVGGVVGFAPAIFGFTWPAEVTDFFDERRTTRLITAMTYAVLASAATVAAVKLRLTALASRARPALGIVLDVDNYLRESPWEATPRAKMAERLASLLRNVEDRRNADGTPYFDRVVFISHSQGTVLTADFLRFLAAEKIQCPEVRAERFRLLTMGSPLRQLYAANFPHLYKWVDSSDDREPRKRDDALAAEALARRTPDPAALRVGKWVNLYTSGDYVGRALWRREDAPGVWSCETYAGASEAGNRRERCLGAGTHTRYWSSAAVAEELDALLV